MPAAQFGAHFKAAAVWSRAILPCIDGETMQVISFEDRLVKKRSTGRKKAIQDANFLLSRRKR